MQPEQQVHGKEADADHHNNKAVPGIEELLPRGKTKAYARTKQSIFVDIRGLDDLQNQKEQEELADKIVAAGKLLPEVTVPDVMLDKVADLAINLGVDGHRSDITMIKTAMAMAAFRGSRDVNTEDLKIAARLALPHRMRRRPFEDGTLDMEKVLAALEG